MFKRYLVLIAALFCGLASEAADVRAPMSGARVSGLTRSSTVGEWNSTVDSSGNLVDVSGSNLLTYSEAFDSWTPTNVTISTNVVRDPYNNLTADTINENSDVAQRHYVTQTYSTTSGYKYTYCLNAKKYNRKWIKLSAASDAATGFFNLDTGVVGTLTSATGSIRPLKGGWYSICTMWTSVTTGAQSIQIHAADQDNNTLYNGQGYASLYIANAQLAKNDEYRKGPGIYHPATAANKPLLDLAPTASPTESKSSLQTADGRRLRARTFNGTTQYYSKAHDASMNIFDGNFTATFLLMRSDAADPAAGDIYFCHGVSGSAGVYFATPASGANWSVTFSNAVGSVPVYGPSVATINDGKYHVVQLKRNSDVATLYFDGVPGSSVNVAGYGIDGAQVLYLGSYNGGASYFWQGDILYTRLDAEALTDIQLAYEREVINGTLFGSANLNPGSTFSRATSSATTVGTATQTYSDGTIGYVAQNIPRVSGDGGGVLVEEQRENKCLQSQTFDNGTWDKTGGNCSITANTAAAPDGTTTADSFNEDATAGVTHGFYQGINVTSGQIYAVSVYFKTNTSAGTVRKWFRLYLSDQFSGATYSYFSTDGLLGTKGADTVQSIDILGNGWVRARISGTADGTGGAGFQLNIAEADNDITFDGQNQTSFYIWGAQVELGAHPTSYIPTTTLAVTRVADSLTIEPWRITKPFPAGATMAMYFDNDVYSGSTYASEIGGYSFTVNGDTKHVESQTLNDYFSFDGTGDYLTSVDSGLNASSSFSIVAIITPSNISGNKCFASNYSSPSGWEFYVENSNISAYIHDGVSFTSVSKASALVANKTSLVTITVTKGAGATDSAVNIYVDALSVQNEPASRFPAQRTSFAIGAVYSGSDTFNGKIHFLAYYSGTVISQTQHDAMYAALKQANALPVKIGNSYENKKLYVEFESKCEFSSLTDIGSARALIEIGGNTGTASVSRNRIAVRPQANGKIILTLEDDSSVESLLTTSTLTGYNSWKKHKIFIDGANLANVQYTIDGTAQTHTLSGTANFDLTNTLVRLGQDYNSTTSGNCAIRNLKLRSAP